LLTFDDKSSLSFSSLCFSSSPSLVSFFRQYFVITDIGKGNYQWYAFLARPPDSASLDEKPDGTSPYLQGIFEGWSPEIHDILKATKENEIEQRDLYDRPPSVLEPWSDGPVALLGDGIHAMMPNLGQGGCQAIEDSYVLAQELTKAKTRSEIPEQLVHYQRRRLVRSASVQGLSRFASDIIIRGFDTPARIAFEDGGIKFENFNYAGIVTRILQPILPIFFMVQFNFLYDGWKNEQEIDLKAAFGFATLGGVIALLMYGLVGEGFLAGLGLTEFGLGLFGAEEILDGGKEIKTAVDFGGAEIDQLKSLLETVVQQSTQ
jgi:zeaxanthin epoxidase